MASTTRAILDFLPFDLSREFFGYTAAHYTEAFIIFVVLAVVFKIIQTIVLFRLGQIAKKTRTDIDDTLVRIVRSVKPAFYWFLAFFFAVRVFEISDFWGQVIEGVLIAWVVYQAVIAIQILIEYIVEKRTAREDDQGTVAAISYLSRIAKWTLWVVAILLVLSNLGVNITSLVAGLGIGGIAIALALQNILGDLFSSFSIYFDKPFVIGDFIVVGEHMGAVEKIGIKTTRIRALQGEEIVISNKELTSTRVQNFKKMRERRVTFRFGVVYETSNEQLGQVKEIVTRIFDEIKDARLDRVHFATFDDSALTYEVIYYVLSGDYNQYMDIQECINLKLKAGCEQVGVAFAYPTQTVYVTNQ